MVAVSPQKLTCDRIHAVLDVWKVGAALELFDTSWAGRGWRNEGRAKWCGLACGVSRRVFGTRKPNLHNALITSIPTLCPKGATRFWILVDIEEVIVERENS